MDTSRSYYRIDNFNESHIEMYRECFTDCSWLNLYGFKPEKFCFESYIASSLLTSYPSVERLVISNRYSQPILFAHLCSENKKCVVVGGLVPHLLGSGVGLSCSAIVFDYAFKNKDINLIEVNIIKSNHASIRMVKSLGFQEAISVCNQEKLILSAARHNFHNDFSRKLLARLNYEKY